MFLNLYCSVFRTCFYVLGNLAKIPGGVELLEEYHWTRTGLDANFPSAVALPKNLMRYLHVCFMARYF